MGEPRVLPSNTPERISQTSPSFRGVTMSLWPGLRRSSSRWMSSGVISSSGGQPSIFTPTPIPWDSPQVDILKMLPIVLDMQCC